MSSRFADVTVLFLVASLCAIRPLSAAELRVCSDPNNLPFSNEHLEGFENEIVTLIARELHSTPVYTWRAQRRGFLRETLKAGRCDVVAGLPSGIEGVALTRPYYRSTYAFVTRSDDKHLTSFDDQVLRRAIVGVQLVGDDGHNPPPAEALARRGITENVRGYHLYADYSHPNPPARIIDAVAGGDIDIGIVWGPTAGYFAARADPPLHVEPVLNQLDGQMPMAFDIAFGVRHPDKALRDALDAALAKNRTAILAILTRYNVPLVPAGAP
ncbi:MAG: substrate-binding domain-containing protein [Hyphomicrobium sp.]|nr:substrate-binding domain-containing protein [Hyphomicrobium sp.]